MQTDENLIPSTSPATDAPAVNPHAARDRRRRIIIIAVSAVLFLSAILFPLFMHQRHLGNLDKSFSLSAKSMKVIVTGWSSHAPAMRNQKIGIAIWTILFLIAGRLIPSKKKFAQWAVTGLLIYMFALSFHNESWNDTKQLLRGKYIQYWNVFHYYFGAKYFDEMGYFYHYAYTLKADVEGKNHLKKIDTINDLFEYRKKPREAILATIEDREDFTPERWEQFSKEMQFFIKFTRHGKWWEMLQDHGYNGTPFWNTIGNYLATHFSLQKKGQRIFVLSLDQVFLLITLIIVGIVFGLRWAVVMGIFFEIIPLNQTYTVGGFIRYDWFCATVIAFCFFKKGWYKAAAPFLAFATMARIFPAFLLLGPGLKWLVDWIKTRKMDRKLFAMFVLFTLFCGIFFYMGTWNRYGFEAWTIFYKNIKQHTEKHYLGPKRIGLKHMFIDDFGTRKVAMDPRTRSFAKQEGLYRVTYFVMMAMFLAAIWRRNREDSFLLGYMFIFTFLVLSRYYWALISMFFLLSVVDRSRWRQSMVEILLFAFVPLFFTFDLQEKNSYANYMTTTFFFFGFFIFLAGSYLIEDFFIAKDWLVNWQEKRKGIKSSEPSEQPAS